MKYLIEKEPYFEGREKYIVWEVHTNYKIDRFRGLKKECKKWLTNIINHQSS